MDISVCASVPCLVWPATACKHGIEASPDDLMFFKLLHDLVNLVIGKAIISVQIVDVKSRRNQIVSLALDKYNYIK